MIAIKRMPTDKFRKDMYKSKRKPLEEIWSGDDLDIANIVRFSPSACNTQPWYIENKEKELIIYRYKKSGKRGIMPIDKVMYYNKIDIGIFLFILEVCLKEKGITFKKELLPDTNDSENEMSKVAIYVFS